MPIANGFIDKKDLDSEYFYNLEVAFCTNCSLFQLIEMPDPKILFNQNYAYHSGQSQFMQSHFKDIAKMLINKYNLKINQFCVEIGNNDGGVVEYLNELGYNHLGVDPSTNVYNIAKSKGINVLNDYFSFDVAKKISKDYKKANFILAANALSHIPDLQSVFSGIENLLSDDGIFITEDPYLIDVFKKISYDQIYDEHVYIFSLTSMQNICSKFGLELFDVEHTNSAGGSLRCFIAKKGVYNKTNNYNFFFDYENKLNLLNNKIYVDFNRSCKKSKEELLKLLKSLTNKNKTICGYSASAKNTTIYNYCGIGTEYIKFLTDTTPIKQNKLSPGMHIPIYDYKYFNENLPDYCFLGAWNLKEEILNKEKNNFSTKGKWISHVPQVHVLNDYKYDFKDYIETYEEFVAFQKKK